MPVAPDYTVLFTRLGRIVKYFNDYLTFQGTALMGSGSGADDILDEYSDRRDLVKSLQSDYESFAGNVSAFNGKLVNHATATLADLRLTLNAPSSGPSTILPLLARQMAVDSQSLDANVISAPVVTVVSGAVGDGTLVCSKLDVDGQDDQRIKTEAVAVACVSDSGTGSTAGGETFSVVGYPSQPTSGSYKTRGSGSTRVTVADSSNLISNGTFETFTANIPDDFTLVAGTAGTHVLQETVNFHRGAGALKLDGDAVATTVTLTYDLSDLLPSTIYAANAWVRKSGTVSAGSNLQIAVTGTGFTTVNLYNADPTGLTTSYAAKNNFFATPGVVPTNLKLTITWTAANTAGATALIYIDDLVLVRPSVLGHVQYAIFAGDTDFAIGDQFTVATANDGAGVFSSWFARVYDQQLPVSGAPTISDTLAT